MDEPAIPGQDRADARRLLARAARALGEDGALSTEGLLPALRAAAPSTHTGAAADALDVAFLARARALGGDALLGARTLRVEAAPWRAPWQVRPAVAPALDRALLLTAPPTESLAGDALLLLAGLALESAKRAHGLPAATDALRAAFPSPAAAQTALAALTAGGDLRRLQLVPTEPRVHVAAVRSLADKRACYVLAGEGAALAHDLLSPFARRLRRRLLELAERAGPRCPRDDKPYTGMSALFAADPAVLAERLEVERADGLHPLGAGALAVSCDALRDGEVDARLREPVALLKRARALLVLVEPWAPTLAAVLDALGSATRAVAVLASGTLPCTPTALVDAATGHTALLDNALADARGTLLSPASLSLAESAEPAAATTFALLQPVFAARARGALEARARVAVRCVRDGEVTALASAALDMLARIAPRPASQGRRR